MRRNARFDEFEEYDRLAAQPRRKRYVLRLYVSGLTPRSGLAITSLRALCEELLAGHYDLQVIDVYQQPELARGAQVVATPTAVKVSPLPVRRLVGDMSNRRRVLAGLDLPNDPE